MTVLTVVRTPQFRLRMWWTALLVLISLGGAGLAVAADRQQNPAQRPEVTWRADQAMQPWLNNMTDELSTVSGDVAGLSTAGRTVLEQLQALNLTQMQNALDGGNDLSSQTDAAVAALTATRGQAAATIEQWRLSQPTLDQLDALDTAVSSAQTVPTLWAGLAADAQLVGGLVDDLLRHDGLVFQATTAGRQARWADALDLLTQAQTPLADAARVRALISGSSDVQTLDDLLARATAYDTALTNLYAYVADGGAQQGDQFNSLQRAVDAAQAALPSDTTALSEIVGEAAGPTLARDLAAIDRARGDVVAALDGLSQ